ncbi:sensor histidine kinase [Mucilaginibacter sp. SG564]|uniref:sensor histidine kinase n=1 Tax=unclassified Mucilaginibacter TaxID=2617802 RepID=UPI0015581088|nr:histidine kinase [Mucilaginibacter sp. SG564]NOW93819.1 hypothetical protein [Mucilaginibacter sp. SG564]
MVNLSRIKPAILLEVLLHVLFWALITLLPLFSATPHRFIPFQHIVLINTLLAVVFYLNAFILIPFYLNEHRQPWIFFFLLILTFLLASVLITCMRPRNFFPPGMFAGHRPPPGRNFFILPLIAITAGSFAYRYLTDHFRYVARKGEIANATMVSEIAFLRSQISPHFMFNVINSVVALSRLNPPAVEPTLIQLSQLLRYMLYVSDEERITLGRKMEYLNSYIQLQKLRFGSAVQVDFDAHIGSPEKTIEPMLLIPFVENAFKHGTGDVTNPSIAISLIADNRMLDFRVSNQYNPVELNKDEHHGIGLNNIKRRLALLYPNKHRLDIQQLNSTYNIHLQLQLK